MWPAMALEAVGEEKTKRNMKKEKKAERIAGLDSRREKEGRGKEEGEGELGNNSIKRRTPSN